MERLWDARAKIERAEAQINELNGHVSAFLKSHPYRLASEIETQGIEVWRYQMTAKPPRLIGVIAGEILHNLRSGLDHLACALAEQHSGSNADTYFPFGKSADIFKGQLASKAKKLFRMCFGTYPPIRHRLVSPK